MICQKTDTVLQHLYRSILKKRMRLTSVTSAAILEEFLEEVKIIGCCYGGC
jgi:hypothetical protein